MNLKVIGAIMIVAACGGFGFHTAIDYKKQTSMLRQFYMILEYISWELQYHHLPLPQLCRLAAVEASGIIRKFFITLAGELDDQIMPDVQQCVHAALIKSPSLPKCIHILVKLFGRNLGKYDLEGQLKGLEVVKLECKRMLDKQSQGQELKLRNYQTLGLCAGAALAILFI